MSPFHSALFLQSVKQPRLGIYVRCRHVIDYLY